MPGFSPARLLELCLVPTADNEHEGFVSSLTNLVKRILLLSSAIRDSDVRPIAVGETPRRLVRSLLMTRVVSQAQQFLQATQLGVRTIEMCEAIVHAIRHYICTHGSHPIHDLLQVDLANAFNLASRRGFLRSVRLHFLQL